MTRPDEIAALAARCREIREWQDTGLLCDGVVREMAKTMPGDIDHQKLQLAEHKIAQQAMDAVIRLSATSPGDAVREALRKSAEGWANAIELGLLPPQHVMSATILRDEAQEALAALAPAEKAGDVEGFGSVRGKLDHLGRRVEAVEMPQALKDGIARCYGLLWMLETEDKRVHRARRGLLSWLTKDEQAWGIENARAICLMNGLDDRPDQKDCPSTTPTPPSADVAKVRALDWQEILVDRGDGSSEVSGWEADSGFDNFYSIEQYFASDSYGFSVKFEFDVIGDFDDPDRAKECAQKDFEKRALALIAHGGGTEGGERTAPASCPNCFNEGDCGSVDVCNAVAEVYSSDPAQEPEAVAWRWLNTAYPNLGWTYTEIEVGEHPSLCIKVEPLYTRPALDREAVARSIDPRAMRHDAAPDRRGDVLATADRVLALIEGRT